MACWKYPYVTRLYYAWCIQFRFTTKLQFVKFRRSDDCFKVPLDKTIKVKNKLIPDSLNYLVFHVGLIPAEVENRLAADTAEHRICSLRTEQLVQQ